MVLRRHRPDAQKRRKRNVGRVLKRYAGGIFLVVA
jgi:hypothetical protein